MKDNNEEQKCVTLKRKTLSLNGNKNIKSDKNFGQVKVEIKRKRSGINNGRVNGKPSNKYLNNIKGTTRLTDDEFRARVKALQDAMKNTPKEIIKNVPHQQPDGNATADKKSELDALQEPGSKTVVENNTVINHNDDNINKTLSNKIEKTETGIIDKLIKMAPKSSKPVQPNTIKPVVFRSDAFVRKTRLKDQSNKDRNDLNGKKGERLCRFNRKSEEMKFYNSSKSVNGSTNRLKQNDTNKKQSLHASRKSSLRTDRDISANYVTPPPQPISKFKNSKPTRKFNSNRDDRGGITINKTDSGKFSKKDLDLAMNDEEGVRTRSLAAIKRAKKKFKSSASSPNNCVVREVNIPDSITVGELANRMAVRTSEVVKYLMSVGTMATINQIIDGETAEIICASFGHVANRISDDDFERELDYSGLDTPDKLSTRSPIVTVMGHVDHGKTTLLDTLKKTSVTKKEAGGITQHVAAYQVKTQSGKEITFIDTPGHAAFSNIRARGANLTDIIVLVVAADDGIKDQTIEVIKEAHNHNVPLVIAINKIDKADIDVNRVKNELMKYEVLLEEFGGDVLCTEISAKNNINLDKLLENILLQAEVLDLKANSERKANCTVLETRMERGRGIVSTVLVNGGTLAVGDVFVAGTTYGKVRTLTDSFGNRIKLCIPATPVEITGFDKVPEPGDTLVVVSSEQKAHEISEKRQELQNRKKANKISIKNVDKMMTETDSSVQNLNVYIKADVYGSLEAVETSLLAIKSSEVSVTIVGKSIGLVNESDIEFAKTSNAVLVCFNTSVTPSAKTLANVSKVKVINYDVIYHLVNAVIEIMESMLPPVIEEHYIGRLLVKKLFFISRLGTIAGGVVVDGSIKKNDSKVKVLRNGTLVFEGSIKSMKHEKDEIKDCGLNHECGILLDDFNNYEEGDYIECYGIVKKSRKIR